MTPDVIIIVPILIVAIVALTVYAIRTQKTETNRKKPFKRFKTKKKIMDTSLIAIIKQFGFPVVAAMGMGGFVWYVWTWVTREVKPVLGDANKTLIALIDRIRMLDNDMIRLTQKLNMILDQQANRNKDKK
jgi:hypothetical protein